MLAIGIAVIAGASWGAVWWEERPLVEVERLLVEKDSWAALSKADRFLRNHPDHGRATALKARALLQLGRADEAARLFDQVGAATDDDMRDCSKAYLMQERWVQALPVLEYLVLLHPDDPDLLHELSACRAKLGRYDDALEAATRFASIAGHEARGQLLIGTLERERSNDTRACEAWARVVEIAPDGQNLQIPADEFFLQYGTALFTSGKPAAAVERLRQSIQFKSTAQARETLGQALSQLGKTAEAEQEWRLAISDHSFSESARQGLAELAMRQSDFRQALELLQPLADSSQLSSSSAFLIQRAYMMSGDKAAAGSWKEKQETIRKREELEHSVDQVLIEAPGTIWGQALRCYRLAQQGNWDQAEILLSPLLTDSDLHPFIAALGGAIRDRGPLPDLSGIPLKLY